MINGIKGTYVLNDLVSHIQEGRHLTIFKYNNELRQRLGLTLEVYEKFSNQIVIEIIPDNTPIQKTFINYIGNPSLYHIYFNDGKEVMKRNYIQENVEVTKIKVVIDQDKKETSLSGLFDSCDTI